MMMYADYMVVFAHEAVIDTKIECRSVSCSCGGLAIAQTHLDMYFGEQWFTLSPERVQCAWLMLDIAKDNKLVHAQLHQLLSLRRTKDTACDFAITCVHARGQYVA
jgi:hypothetical protein